MIGEIIHLLIIVSGLIWGVVLLISNFINKEDKSTAVVLIFIFGLLILAFPGMQMWDNSHEYITPIVSLERGNSLSGNFVLGFGSINGKPVYYAYQSLGNSKYKLREFSGDTIIIETNNKIPHHRKYLNCWKDWIFYDCFFEHKNEIYVPIGTIQRRFEV